jgi:hypothetical protein
VKCLVYHEYQKKLQLRSDLIQTKHICKSNTFLRHVSTKQLTNMVYLGQDRIFYMNFLRQMVIITACFLPMLRIREILALILILGPVPQKTDPDLYKNWLWRYEISQNKKIAKHEVNISRHFEKAKIRRPLYSCRFR